MRAVRKRDPRDAMKATQHAAIAESRAVAKARVKAAEARTTQVAPWLRAPGCTNEEHNALRRDVETFRKHTQPEGFVVDRGGKSYQVYSCNKCKQAFVTEVRKDVPGEGDL